MIQLPPENPTCNCISGVMFGNFSPPTLTEHNESCIWDPAKYIPKNTALIICCGFVKFVEFHFLHKDKREHWLICCCNSLSGVSPLRVFTSSVGPLAVLGAPELGLIMSFGHVEPHTQRLHVVIFDLIQLCPNPCLKAREI